MKRYIVAIRLRQGASVAPENIVEVKWHYENNAKDHIDAVGEVVTLLWPEDQLDDDRTTAIEFWVRNGNTKEESQIRAVHPPNGAPAVLMSGLDQNRYDHLLSLPRF